VGVSAREAAGAQGEQLTGEHGEGDAGHEATGYRV
jgi:hypothetical protein